MPLVVILHVRLRDLGALAVISLIFVWCPLMLDDQITSRILTIPFFLPLLKTGLLSLA